MIGEVADEVGHVAALVGIDAPDGGRDGAHERRIGLRADARVGNPRAVKNVVDTRRHPAFSASVIHGSCTTVASNLAGGLGPALQREAAQPRDEAQLAAPQRARLQQADTAEVRREEIAGPAMPRPGQSPMPSAST